MQFVANLLVGRRRKTDAARLANSLEPRRDVDPVAHQVAVGLLDDVAQVNADASLDPLVGGQTGVALSQAATHFHGAANGLDHAAKFDERAVAGPLDDPPVVDRDRRVDEVAAQSAQPRQRQFLVSARQPAVADDVGDQNRRELSRLGHKALSPRRTTRWVEPIAALLRPPIGEARDSDQFVGRLGSLGARRPAASFWHSSIGRDAGGRRRGSRKQSWLKETGRTPSLPRGFVRPLCRVFRSFGRRALSDQ